MRKRKWLLHLFVVGLITPIGACILGDDEETGDQPPTNSAGSPDIEMAFPDAQGVLQTGLFETARGQEQLEYESFDGQAVFQSDILLPPPLKSGSQASLLPGTGRTDRAFYWPNNTVFYEIAPNLPNQQRVHDAIAHWEARTTLRFAQATAATTHYVRFVPSTGCSSFVGRQPILSQPQPINLATGCTTGNTIHEIGHAIGLWHEHTRADRDNHVTIHWQNILTGTTHNFRTYVQQGFDGFDHGAYDITSIMHYGSDAFSANGNPTITRLDGSTFGAQRTELTAGDAAIALQMYPPPFNPAWMVPIIDLTMQ